MDLTNASAIVTGGAGGFGSATVRRLAQMGAKVVIADVSKSALDARLGSGPRSWRSLLRAYFVELSLEKVRPPPREDFGRGTGRSNRRCSSSPRR